MTKLQEDFLHRPLYVYHLPPLILDTLSLKSDIDVSLAAEGQTDSTQHSVSVSVPPAASSDSPAGSHNCSLCSLKFVSPQEQRSHIKSDLHNYNLKQKLRGQSAVTENKFERLIEDLDESLSGSDSSESEDNDKEESTLTTLLKKQARLADKSRAADEEENDQSEGAAGRGSRGASPLVWFSSPQLPENTYFGMYRAIMTSEEQHNSDIVEVVRKKQLESVSVPKPLKDGTLPEIAYKGPHIFLCMIGGGHFAAMIVSLAPRPVKGSIAMNREATVLAHKTFHRYTTRRKQGGSQSANDNAKGTAHSAGSSLRRYNEQALAQDVRALLEGWKGLLDTAELLFIRATGTMNKRTLFGPSEGQVLRQNDTRLRGFPFNTRRPTQNELMRSFIELTRFKVLTIDPAQAAAAAEKAQAPTAAKPPSPKPTKPKLTEEEMALLHTSQIQAFVRRSKLPALLSYLKNNNLSPDFELQPPEKNHHTPRVLHLAAAQNAAPLVLGLLARAEANPSLQNGEGKMPFELAGDRPTRDAFRVARSELGESRWPWDKAKVPPPMSKAEADSRDAAEKREAEEKEARRRRVEEERLRSEGPKVTENRKKGNTLSSGLTKTAQEKREEESRGLTPEMKTKLERERRARAAEARIKALQGGR